MKTQPEMNHRPDLVRTKAVKDAMRDSAGKKIRTAEEAEAWIDKSRPDLTEAWLSWLGENIGK